MKILLPLLVAVSLTPALLINPVIDTDKSVNAYSLSSIAADLTDNSMADTAKLKALFSYHRRMMHHFRLNFCEDGTIRFDPMKCYTVYGCSWCTQQANVFRALCSEVFGWSNTEGTAGSGMLASRRVSGGHSSFHLRFRAGDTWHWVDPIVGAYAKNRADGAIASYAEMLADPAILVNAERDGRASDPFMPCTKGSEFIPTGIAAAYSYFDYDTAFTADFASNWTRNQYTTQGAYFTTRKSLKKGESYLWLWDHLEGNYFNRQDGEYDTTRVAGVKVGDKNWAWYPPRHLCGWKDSLDRTNWPYLKPYKKVIKGDACYRYYANGIHTWAPDFATGDPKDGAASMRNIAFKSDDPAGPGVHPATVDSTAEIIWRLNMPYPLMSLHLSCSYVCKGADDSIVITMKRLRFRESDDMDQSNEAWPNYRDTLTPDSLWTVIKTLPVSADSTYETSLRDWVDPFVKSKTYQGCIVRLTMKARGSRADVGINALRTQMIFQHNMFALPQLEPGANRVTLTLDSGDLSQSDLKLAFAWNDSGAPRLDIHPITAAPAAYTLTVKQPDMPRMLHMALGNTRDPAFGLISAEKSGLTRLSQPLEINASPNPFTSAIRLTLPVFPKAGALKIYDPRGRLIDRIDLSVNRRIVEWNGRKWPSGIYLVRWFDGNRTAVKRIVLAR